MDYNWLREKAALAKQAAEEAAARAAEEAAKAAADVQAAAADVQAAAKEHARDIAANTQGIAEGILSGDFMLEGGEREIDFEEGPLGFNLQGGTVIETDPNGQAAQKGIQPGDTMISIAGEPLPPLPANSSADDQKKMKLLIQRRIKAQPRPIRMCFTRGSTDASLQTASVSQMGSMSSSISPSPAVSSSAQVNPDGLMERIRTLEAEKTREADRALALDSKLTQARNDLSEAQGKAQQELTTLKERARDACTKLKEECMEKIEKLNSVESREEASLRKIEALTQELCSAQSQPVVTDDSIASPEEGRQEHLEAADTQLLQRLVQEESQVQRLKAELIQKEDRSEEEENLVQDLRQQLQNSKSIGSRSSLATSMGYPVEVWNDATEDSAENISQDQQCTDALRAVETKCEERLQQEEALVQDLRYQAEIVETASQGDEETQVLLRAAKCQFEQRLSQEESQIQLFQEKVRSSEVTTYAEFEAEISASETKVQQQHQELALQHNELSQSQELSFSLTTELKESRARAERDAEELGDVKKEIAEALKCGGDSAAALGLKDTQLRIAEDKIAQEQAKTDELRERARAALTRAREGAQSEIEAEQEELFRYQEDLGAAKLEVRACQSSLQKSESDIASLKKALEEEQEERDTARWASDAQTTGLNEQLQQTKAGLGSELAQVKKELGSELATMQKRFADTDAARKAASTKAAGLEHGLEKALSEMKKHQESSHKLTTEMESIRAENREHQFAAAHRDTTVKGAQAVLERKAQSLEEQLEHSHTEQKAAGLQIESLNAKLQHAEGQCSQLQSDLQGQAKLAAELKDLQEEHSVLCTKELQGASALIQAKEEIASLVEQCQKAQEQVQALSSGSVDAKDQCASLRAEVEEAKAARAAAERQCDEARTMMKDFRESAAVAQESEASHRQLIKSLQRELSEAREETTKAKNKLEQVHTELATTKEQLVVAQANAAAAAAAPPPAPSPSEATSVTIDVGAGEDLATETIIALRGELSELKKQNKALQKSVDSKPITFAPSEEQIEEMAMQELERRPVWERRLRVALEPVAKKADGGLRLVTSAILKRQALHLVFWAHLFILYAISASCIAQEAPDPSNCAEEFMKRAGAATP